MRLNELHDDLRFHSQAMLSTATRGNFDGYDDACIEVTRLMHELRIEMEWVRENRPLMAWATRHWAEDAADNG
jgi:hypothetical protein